MIDIQPVEAWHPARRPNGVRRLRQGIGPETVICIHPISGMVTAYANLLQALPRDLTVLGIEADRDIEPQTPGMGLAALGEAYAARIRPVAERGPVAIVGWCIGADIAIEVAARLSSEPLDIVTVVAIDPNYDFDDTWLARHTATGAPNILAAYWSFFVLMACGAALAEEIMASAGFRDCTTDEQRVRYVYDQRVRRSGRGPIAVYPPNPRWQLDFIMALTEQSRGYQPPKAVQYPLTLVGSTAHRAAAFDYAARIDAATMDVLLFESDHYGFMDEPIIGRIADGVLAAIRPLPRT